MGQAGVTGSGQQLEERYFLQKVKLGQGSFGTVWRAVDRANGSVVAMKQLDKASMPKRGVTRRDIEREVQMMKTCVHPNITAIYDHFEDDKSIFLALEYCDGGDFGDKVKERGMNLTEDEASDWMAQICAAIQVLHQAQICHRDIKPDNFMVAGSTVKVSDFGLACFVSRGKLLTDNCGTPAFMAPEQVTLKRGSRGYSFPCDMWAAGVTMYMLMFGGRHPFLNGNNLDERMLCAGQLDFREDGGGGGGGGLFGVLLGGGPSGPLRFSDQARKICQRMVEPIVSQRVTAQDALRDPWLARAASRLGGGWQAAAPPVAQPQPVVQPMMAPPRGEPTPARAGMGAGDGLPARGGVEVFPMERRERPSQEQNRVGWYQETAAPAAGQPRGNAALRVGQKCQYYSSSYGWMAAVVMSVNEHDGSYNLDVRQHAAPDKMMPCQPGDAGTDIWPVGTMVFYESASGLGLLPGNILGFNSSDNTYSLDVHPHAPAERIRARLGDRRPVEEGGRRSVEEGVRSTAMHTEAPSGPEVATGGLEPSESFPVVAPMPAAPVDGFGPVGIYMQGPPAQAPMLDRARTGFEPARAPGVTSVASGDDRVQPVPAGCPCYVCSRGEYQQGAEWYIAVIDSYNPVDGLYSVVAHPKGAPQIPMQVRSDAIRAPKDEKHAWPPNTMVSYYSNSLNSWIPGCVRSFNGQMGTYNLDVHESAAPDRVRPR